MTLIALLVFLLGVCSTRATPVASCTKPKGVEFITEDDAAKASTESGASGTITTMQVRNLLDGTTLGNPLPFLFLPLVDTLIAELVSAFETPIQFRVALYQGNAVYNVAAMFHPFALDIWGLAITYAFAYSAMVLIPSITEPLTFIMDNVLNLPMSNLLDESPPDIGTPWGLARATVDDMTEYSKSDGWNADGSLANDFNKMPFGDFDYMEYSRYKAKDSLGSLNATALKEKVCGQDGGERTTWNWEPLLETDYRGYFSKQEHVTPFAGFTGRLYGLTVEEYESFAIAPPEYNYCQEADFVLSETREAATDDQKKAEVEAYDSKFTSLLPMQINWSIATGVSSFEFWYMDMALVTAMYDATMLVWREKVVHDAVRPTTVVHALKGDEEVTTYAGPYEGSKTIRASDWQPFIRTMPHAEYPSGSSCICTAYAETLQALTGSDDTGIPASMGGARWILQDGTRPDPRGGREELCTGLASLVVDRAKMLRNGEATGALADRGDESIVVKSRQSVVGRDIPDVVDDNEDNNEDDNEDVPDDVPNDEDDNNVEVPKKKRKGSKKSKNGTPTPTPSKKSKKGTASKF
ncbi:unnamed protein product [Pseudo-nitzschia multistriata]|uniref:Vanadium-dependent haloperoxidase NapH1-like second helical-bundle domain-containing protein n=1 Tax=Pseudo-nitzschia multistriata TaxID=183589 RepID=A0A448Z7Y0_9STRA|nr:unnamed protein product [Pseudo-nitzschia multistriata]